MKFIELFNSDEFYNFYGVDGNYFKIGNCIFECVEDENDGYRSSLEEIRVIEDADIIQHLIFQSIPICKVRIVDHDGECFDGYKLISESGHCWLEFGTDYYDGYYPLFIVRYNPKVGDFDEHLSTDEDYNRYKETINERNYTEK